MPRFAARSHACPGASLLLTARRLNCTPQQRDKRVEVVTLEGVDVALQQRSQLVVPHELTIWLASAMDQLAPVFQRALGSPTRPGQSAA